MNSADKIKLKEVSAILNKSLKNIYAITDSDGLEAKNKERYFESAKRAAEKNQVKQDGKIVWKPIVINIKVIGTVGFKESNNKKEQLELIDGLIDEISYELFLKEQAGKYLDPKSDFIKKILCGNKVSSLDQAIDMADILGLNLRSQQAVILIEVPGLFKKFHEKFQNMSKEKTDYSIGEECKEITNVLKKSFGNYEQNIFTCLEPDTFVALKWARGQINTLNTINFYRKKAQFMSDIIFKKTKIKPTIGVGQYYPGLAGLRKSYVDAKTSLELGKKIWGPGSIYHISDVGMFVSFSPLISYDRKCELAHQIMGQLFKDESLYKTVEAFLESDMSLTDAAKKLHLHRNTLIYRLDKIKKETGLDPRKFSDSIQIKLGMMLYGPRSKNC